MEIEPQRTQRDRERHREKIKFLENLGTE